MTVHCNTPLVQEDLSGLCVRDIYMGHSLSYCGLCINCEGKYLSPQSLLTLKKLSKKTNKLIYPIIEDRPMGPVLILVGDG